MNINPKLISINCQISPLHEIAQIPISLAIGIRLSHEWRRPYKDDKKAHAQWTIQLEAENIVTIQKFPLLLPLLCYFQSTRFPFAHNIKSLAKSLHKKALWKRHCMKIWQMVIAPNFHHLSIDKLTMMTILPYSDRCKVHYTQGNRLTAKWVQN